MSTSQSRQNNVWPQSVSWSNWRFWGIAVLYLLSFVLMTHDPFFIDRGAFVYKQGMLAIVLAFVITSAVNWEFYLFGKPAGGNLLLQVLQLLPFSLVLARLTGKPAAPALPGSTLEAVKWFVSDVFSSIMSWIPLWIREIFANWQLSLLLLAVMLLFGFKSVKIKIGILISLLFFLLAGNLAGNPSIDCLLSLSLFAAGLALQFQRYGKVVYFENVIAKLRLDGEIDSLKTAAVCRIMTSLYEEKKLSEMSLLLIVKDVYAKSQSCTGPELKLIAGEITRQLVFHYHFAVLSCDGNGWFLAADPRLRRCDNLLSAVSVVPRMVLAAVITLFWILIPVDLIPDAIPVFGVLDDLTLSALSLALLKNAWASLHSEE